jgi:hypothetical protein
MFLHFQDYYKHLIWILFFYSSSSFMHYLQKCAYLNYLQWTYVLILLGLFYYSYLVIVIVLFHSA